MELRQVLLALGTEWKAQVKKLKRVLSKEGICCICFDGEQTKEQKNGKEGAGGIDLADPDLAEYDQSDTIVITDEPRLASRLAKRGIVCVGCDRGEEAYFEGAVLVTDMPEALDVRTLDAYLLRASGRPVTIAVTDRLILREITEQDLHGLYQIDEHFEPEKMAAYLRCAYRFYGYGLWSVLLKDGTLVGCCGYADAMEQYDLHGKAGEPKQEGDSEQKDRSKTTGGRQVCLELQYIVSEAFRRQGYGEEMCRAALEYAYRHLHADEVWVRIEKSNRASLALAEKLKFVQMYTDRSGLMYWRKSSQEAGREAD